MTTESVLLRRRLSVGQQERRQRVIDVASELAEQGGYDAVAMKDVADRSGVALATLYRWFASKDHLLGEVLLEWGARVEADLRSDPPSQPSGADRILEFVRRFSAVVATYPRLVSAVTSALLSLDPNVVDHQDDFHEMTVRWIDTALGDLDVHERDTVIDVLEAVCFSGIVGLVSGRHTPDEFGTQLERAARLLLASSARD
jgi:TetR/AcrR family transcriptional regulator, cholesterol catabolism regulator